MTTHFKEDPLQNLELIAAACVLGPQLYVARAEAFGTPAAWHVLNAAERQTYIDLAIEMLLRVQPTLRVTYPKAVD